jgi:hypothetical protein
MFLGFYRFSKEYRVDKNAAKNSQGICTSRTGIK